MSQYDAAATPMWECFMAIPDLKPFTAIAATYNIHEMNVQVSSISRKSAGFNLAVMDAAPDLEFSEVIWKAIKGLESEMPAPVRSAFIRPMEEDEEGEEDD